MDYYKILSLLSTSLNHTVPEHMINVFKICNKLKRHKTLDTHGT